MTDGYQALHHGAAWIDFSERGRIAVRGRDRARLLHNLTSNDVKKLTPGAGCYAFLLSPQGRIQADLNLFCFADHFLIDTEPELREKVLSHIRRYIIADQVELEDVTESTGCVGLEGPGAPALLVSLGASAPETPYAHTVWGDRIVAAVTATGQPGARIFVPTSGSVTEIVPLLESAGAKAATADDTRTVRIENGRPRYGEDIGDTRLPQETQQMHAINFTKGCYLGQEIVERIRAQGHVNRKLMRIELDGSEAPAPGTKTAVDGNEAEITSAVRSPESGRVTALAYVRVPRQ
jgi:tRNA-modifying protein YgfZ